MCNWRIAGVLTLAMTGGVHAGTQQESVRPEGRPQAEVTRLATASLTYSLRPTARPQTIKAKETPVQENTSNGDFQIWLREFRTRAIAQGITPHVLDAAFDGVTYDADIIRRDRNQSEFSKAIWEYLDSAVSDTRLRNGKSALNQHRATLEAIEARYGVEKEVVVAVWGLESAYGSYRGSTDIVRALATLAYDARRSAFFEEQLIAALKILQSGDTTARKMTGSWAGAMGHTQFMPTSYLDYAVDFTGDGKRDIWSDDPSDALASTAAYLARFGWTSGQPWGVEVTLPQGFDFRLADRKIRKPVSHWARMGVAGVNGAIADHGPASLLLPAGGKGPAFLIFQNFAVIERYNSADAYVIGVGHLSDRIAGRPPIQANWPRSDRALTLSERKEMQQRLTDKGFDTQGVDGRIGPLTIDAVRAYQVASGLTPDGYASMNLLKRLR
ncbi:lytic murein transglycosylase [Sedimentitalea sp. XS_ASV28]